MKKIIICLLTLLVLVGCGQKDNNTNVQDRPSSDTLGGKLANAFLDEAEKTDDITTIAENIVALNYT